MTAAGNVYIGYDKNTEEHTIELNKNGSITIKNGILSDTIFDTSDDKSIINKEYVDGKLTSINTTLNTLDNQINDTNTGLVKQVNDNTSDITTMKTTIGDTNTGLVKQVNDNTTNITNMKTTIGDTNNGLVKQVNDNTSDITNMKTTIGDTNNGLIKQVNTLDNQINDANNGLIKQVNDNTSDITNMKTTIGDTNTGLVKQVNTLDNQINDTNTGLVKQVNDNTSDITNMKTTIGDTNNGLIKQVNDNTSDITNMKTTIGDTNNGLVKQVNDNTSDITNMKTTIGDTNNGLVKQVNDNTSDITTMKTTIGDTNTGLVKQVNDNTTDISNINAQLSVIGQSYFVDGLTTSIPTTDEGIIFYCTGAEPNFVYTLMEWNTEISPAGYKAKNVPNNTTCIVKDDATYIKTSNEGDNQVWVKNVFKTGDTLYLTNTQTSLVASGNILVGANEESPVVSILKEDGTIKTTGNIQLTSGNLYIGAPSNPNASINSNGNITTSKNVIIGNNEDNISINAPTTQKNYSNITSTNANGINIDSDINMNGTQLKINNETNNKTLKLSCSDTNKSIIKSNDDITIFKGDNNTMGNNDKGMIINDTGINIKGDTEISNNLIITDKVQLKTNSSPIDIISKDTNTSTVKLENIKSISINNKEINDIDRIDDNDTILYTKGKVDNMLSNLNIISSNYNVSEIRNDIPSSDVGMYIFTYINNIYTLMKYINNTYTAYNDAPNGSICFVSNISTIYVKYPNENSHQVWVKQDIIDLSQTITLSNNQISLITNGNIEVNGSIVSDDLDKKLGNYAVDSIVNTKPSSPTDKQIIFFNNSSNYLELIQYLNNSWVDYNVSIGSICLVKNTGDVYIKKDNVNSHQNWEIFSSIDKSATLHLTNTGTSLETNGDINVNSNIILKKEGNIITNSLSIPGNSNDITPISIITKSENKVNINNVDSITCTTGIVSSSPQSNTNIANKLYVDTQISSIESNCVKYSDVTGIDSSDDLKIYSKKYIDKYGAGQTYYYEHPDTHEIVKGGEIFNVYSGDNKNSATGNYSHAEGYHTIASGSGGSHAEGAVTIASGYSSHAGGQGTIADQNSMTAIGKYNTENNTNTLFVVGNGTNDDNVITRNDAFVVKDTGDCNINGQLNIFNINSNGTSLKINNQLNNNSLELNCDDTNKSTIKSEDNISIYKGTGDVIGNNNGIVISNNSVLINGNIINNNNITSNQFTTTNASIPYAISDSNDNTKTKLQNISSLTLNSKEITDTTKNSSDNDDKIITTKKYVDNAITSSQFDPTQPLTLSGNSTSLTVQNNAVFNKNININNSIEYTAMAGYLTLKSINTMFKNSNDNTLGYIRYANDGISMFAYNDSSTHYKLILMSGNGFSLSDYNLKVILY